MQQNLRGRAPRVDVALRPLHASDLVAVHRLVQDVGWPHRVEDCAMMLDLGAGVMAVGAGNQPIGTGMVWSFGRAVAALGMVLVSPEHQGRGVGRAIMEALMQAAGPRALMLHATTEGMPLYAKLGFHPAGIVRQHQGRLIPGLALLSAAPKCVRRAVATDEDAIHLLDERAFGAKRSALLTRLTHLGQTWVAEENKRLTGFALRRAFGRGEIIGPVVARNEEEAIALIAGAMSDAPPGVLRIDVPGEAERLGSWLAAAGLAPIDTVAPMRRGPWPAVGGDTHRFALAFQAVG